MMTVMKIWNGYRYAKENRHRELGHFQEDCNTDERRISPAPSYCHSLQDVEGWGTEHPQGIRQESQATEEKGRLQKKNVEKKKRPIRMGRVHL